MCLVTDVVCQQYSPSSRGIKEACNEVALLCGERGNLLFLPVVGVLDAFFT
jgi:hypothetical protein